MSNDWYNCDGVAVLMSMSTLVTDLYEHYSLSDITMMSRDHRLTLIYQP